jgi:hypothetical protein
MRITIVRPGQVGNQTKPAICPWLVDGYPEANEKK